MPLQKYYRFALDVDSAPRAKFASLPKHQVLTLRVDTPEAWDAQMASASSDPDNIRDGDARIVYELKSLVVMGQCYDVVDSRPPNGLQIQLEGTASDTLVMQNLGATPRPPSPAVDRGRRVDGVGRRPSRAATPSTRRPPRRLLSTPQSTGRLEDQARGRHAVRGVV